MPWPGSMTSALRKVGAARELAVIASELVSSKTRRVAAFVDRGRRGGGVTAATAGARKSGSSRKMSNSGGVSAYTGDSATIALYGSEYEDGQSPMSSLNVGLDAGAVDLIHRSS